MSSEVEAALQAIRGLSASSFKNENDRAAALHEAQALCRRLETPFEAISRLTYEEPAHDFALATACDMSLFDYLTESPKTTDELAAPTSTQPSLLRRVLRHLAAKGTIVECGEDLWAATDLSLELRGPDAAAGVTWGGPMFQRIQAAGRDYLREKGYSAPVDPKQTFLQALLGDNRSFYEYLQRRPGTAKIFGLQLGYAAECHPSWLDMCDSKAILEDKELQDRNAVAFVDVGGGIGVDVAEVRKRYPRKALPARVVLQDVPKVIEEARLNGEETLAEVELKAYDFFTPQPVEGAKVYFLSTVLHDWPDQQARAILGRVAAAMRKGFSKLIISDYVVPPTGCKAQVSAIDVLMMSLFGSAERVRADWERLLTSNGMTIVQVHTAPAAFKSLIEAELAD